MKNIVSWSWILTVSICLNNVDAFQGVASPILKTTSAISITSQNIRYYTAQQSHRKDSKHIILNVSPLSFPLISASDNWANVAVLTSTASISHKIGSSSAIGKLLGAPVTAMAIAFVLGSIGVLPSGGSSGQKMLQLLSIQLATPLLLLGVNIKECRQRCGPLLKSFILASASTLVACLAAYPLCSKWLTSTMDIDGLKIAAALMAKNIGGGLNYVAVSRSLESSANAVAAGLCVDNIFALIYFPVTSALSAGRADVEEMEESNKTNGSSNNDEKDGKITTESVSAAIAIASIVTWLGERIGGTSGALPLATSFTILFTLFFPNTAKRLSSTGETLGTSLLYIFFATAGAPGAGIADSVRKSFAPIGLYLSLLYGFHGIVLFGSRWASLRFFGKDKKREGVKESNTSSLLPQRLLVASSAAIGGPATAAALAKANGWHSLVAPSLIVGNLGYAIATFLGIAFHAFFK